MEELLIPGFHVYQDNWIFGKQLVNMSQVIQVIDMLLQSVKEMVYSFGTFSRNIFWFLFDAMELFTAKFQSLGRYLPF